MYRFGKSVNDLIDDAEDWESVAVWTRAFARLVPDWNRRLRLAKSAARDEDRARELRRSANQQWRG